MVLSPLTASNGSLHYRRFEYDSVEAQMGRYFAGARFARLLAATGVAGLATLALVWLKATAAAAGVVFLTLVVISATQAGMGLSLYIAALCAISFDYYFLTPLYTLLIGGVDSWTAMIAFLSSCAVVSRVAEQARRQTRQAEQRQADVERLYALSHEMMLHGETETLIHDLPQLIRNIFALESVALYVSDQERFFASDADVPAAEVPGTVKVTMRAMTLGGNPTLALDHGYQVMALTLGMRPVGSLAWRSPALSLEVSTAVGAQVAIVLARSMAIESSRRISAAREGERLRTALIDSLTHELRTPLTSIRAASTTLLDAAGLDEAGRLEMAKIIDEESARLDLLIGEAVEMAEYDADVVRMHPAPHHPRALLEQAVEESRKALATHKVIIQAEDPDEPCWFDSQLLRRVLRHLLENAAAHTQPSSHITLTSRRAGDRLEFSVEDNGPGIDAQDLPLIFDKFYRGKRGNSRGKGSGMGLAITRSILKVHGGGIEAQSEPGKGAAFRFWVPLVEKAPDA